MRPNHARYLSKVFVVFSIIAGFTISLSTPLVGQRHANASLPQNNRILQSVQAQLSAAVGAQGADFGFSVALSGNTALVGDLAGGIWGDRLGYAYVFERRGSTWNLQSQLIPVEPYAAYNFGTSVAISGDTAVVGAVGRSSGPGAVYIFQRNGTTWAQQPTLHSNEPTFGRSVAISGNTIIVGAHSATTSVYQSGAAFVYRFNGSTWAQEAQLFASDRAHSDQFGLSVAFSGDTAVVGAFSDDTTGGIEAGSAYVFQRTASTWTEQAHLVASDTAAGDFFGCSVGISGDTVVVGSYGDNPSFLPGAGSAYIYHRTGTTWSEQPKLVASDAKPHDRFGYSVTINGDTVAVGANLYDTLTTENAGAAYIFHRFNSAWTQTGMVAIDNPAPGDLFGSSIAISDNTIIVGAINGDTPQTTNRGTASVYILRPTVRNPADFDGDNLADVSVFRPANNTWYALQSSNGASFVRQFGTGGDRLTPGDYDGDGKADVAVWRPSSGTWYILNSSNNVLRSRQFGTSGDRPVPGDYDGDGLTDIAVFRPSNGTWYIQLGFTNIFSSAQFGSDGDLPVPGDYDGDTKTDLAVLRPSNNTWYILRSLTSSVRAQEWGSAGDIAVPRDFDGDTQTDLAVFRPSDGVWHILHSTLGSVRSQPWGTGEDIAAPADYDGDGKVDVTVFRPSNGNWYILQSGSNALRAEQWGTAGDIPIAASPIP